MCDFFALHICLLLSELLSALCNALCFLAYRSEILWTKSLLDIRATYKHCDIIVIAGQIEGNLLATWLDSFCVA